ncbi:MAG: hypothetical protein M0R17_09085 [Candidatus Omnitrophica bacterium]|jgi:hypothetical protein|nr:hypothetical protein [Candidatus Omnitrophota bacterium]
MKIQIDTEQKTIKIEEKVNLKTLFALLKSTFPVDWESYDLLTDTIINWNTPQIVFNQPTNIPNWSDLYVTGTDKYDLPSYTITTDGNTKFELFDLTNTYTGLTHIYNIELK